MIIKMVEQNVDDQDVENHENGVKHDVISEVVEKQKGVEDAVDAVDAVEQNVVANVAENAVAEQDVHTVALDLGIE